MTTLTDNQLANARAAYLEITDRLYTLQQAAQMDEDWVMETSKAITADFKKATGVDLEEL